MCNIWKIYGADPLKAKEELTVDEIRLFLTNNRDFLKDILHIGFTGGEPLCMRDDFTDIVELFHRELPWVQLGVQTNGLQPDLTRKKLKKIYGFCPNFSIAVSIDGVKDTHVRMRGAKKAFEKAIQTIHYARELGIKHITCGMTLTPDNFSEITQVKKVVEGLGCEFSCFLAEQAEYFNNYTISRSYLLSDEQKEQVIKQLSSFASSHYYMDNLCLLLGDKRRPKVLCFSGFTSLVIDPYGNVKPCILKVKGVDDDVFGNIRSQTLISMLKNPKAKKIKEGIKNCSCWCQCEVTSSAMVFPLDVLKWFIFYCSSRQKFLKTSFKRIFREKLT